MLSSERAFHWRKVEWEGGGVSGGWKEEGSCPPRVACVCVVIILSQNYNLVIWQAVNRDAHPFCQILWYPVVRTHLVMGCLFSSTWRARRESVINLTWNEWRRVERSGEELLLLLRVCVLVFFPLEEKLIKFLLKKIIKRKIRKTGRFTLLVDTSSSVSFF